MATVATPNNNVGNTMFLVLLSTQEYNGTGELLVLPYKNAGGRGGGVPVMDCIPSRRRAILLVASCYDNWSLLPAL